MATTRKRGSSRKGKVPPQLKAYLFKKGGAKSKSKVKGATTNKKRSTRPKKSSAKSSASKSKVTVSVNGKVVHKA